MPNIYIRFDETEEPICCGGSCAKYIPVQVSTEVDEGPTEPIYAYDKLDPEIASHRAVTGIEKTTVQRGRRSWWKRTRKFVRQLFCCVHGLK